MAKEADAVKLRAWYAHRQGLDGGLAGRKPAEVLKQVGWARSVGSVGPYLTLFSRAGISREQADAAIAKLEIHELPSARGCTYVLPASDFGLGLKVGRGFSEAPLKVAAKLGVTLKEIDKLCGAVLKALAKEPMDPRRIRDATGNASRSLGDEGKKKGVSTTLPLALGELQARGEIRRIATNGRLDQEHYQYALWNRNPLRDFKLSGEQAMTELARKYFSWIGPATQAEFQWLSGLGVKAAKAAVEPLKLEPLAAGDDRLLLAEDRERLEAFKVPRDAQYALVSSLDSMVILRRHTNLLDASDLTREVFMEKGYGKLGAMGSLPSHAILDRGRTIGLWEYDTATESIAWMAFVKKNRDLEKAVARTEEFVRAQLGDARSVSLDSPKSRAPRVEAIRRAAAQ